MDDRIKLVLMQPTKKHRQGILWVLGKRYPKEIAEIKRLCVEAWDERKRLQKDK